MHRIRSIAAPCALVAGLAAAGFAGAGGQNAAAGFAGGGGRPGAAAGSGGGGQNVNIRPGGGAPAAPRGAAARPNVIRTDVRLVLVPVTVTDNRDRPFPGLQPENFRVFDEGVEQTIASFSREEAPVSVGIVIDASSSMRKKIDESRMAITEFLKSANPEDEFFMMRFNEAPTILSGFTNDPREIERLLPEIEPDGWTALLDAIYLALNRMKQAQHTRRALLVLSDGDDNSSRYTSAEIRNLLREADVRVFAISVLDKSALLQKLAEESGGQSYAISKLEQLPEVGARISETLRSEYVLGFAPSPEHNDGKYRKLKIKLAPPAGSPRLRVSWRRGYYAPGR